MRFKLYLSNWTPDRFEIHSVARSKVATMIPGLYLILFKMWYVPGFHSAGHIISLFDFCLPYIQETPKQWQKMFVYLLECSNSELLHSVQETMHQSRGQTTHLY